MIHIGCVRLVHVCIVSVSLRVTLVERIVRVRSRLIHVMWVSWLLVLTSTIERLLLVWGIPSIGWVAWIVSVNWLDWGLGGRSWRVYHGSEGGKQFSFVYTAIVVGVNRLNGLQSLLLVDCDIYVEGFEEIVEETGHFLLIESSGFVSIVFVEYLLDVAFEHLVFQVAFL